MSEKVLGTDLWSQVQTHLNPSEVEPVRRAIGLSIIEKNRDLLHEVEALKEIVSDLQIENGKRDTTTQEHEASGMVGWFHSCSI